MDPCSGLSRQPFGRMRGTTLPHSSCSQGQRRPLFQGDRRAGSSPEPTGSPDPASWPGSAPAESREGGRGVGLPLAHFLPPHLSRPLLLLLSGIVITSDKQPSVLSDKRGSKALACLRPPGLGGCPGWEPGGSRCTHSTRQARSRLEQRLYLLWASVSPSVKGGVWLGISRRALPAGKALTCLMGALRDCPSSLPALPRTRVVQDTRGHGDHSLLIQGGPKCVCAN